MISMRQAFSIVPQADLFLRSNFTMVIPCTHLTKAIHLPQKQLIAIILQFRLPNHDKENNNKTVYSRSTKSTSKGKKKVTIISQKHKRIDSLSPALTPEAPAFFKPFFLTIKLAPIKELEDSARTKPLMLSEDMPVYDSTQLPADAASVDAIPKRNPDKGNKQQTKDNNLAKTLRHYREIPAVVPRRRAVAVTAQLIG
ncbi:hypothetical protein BHE74_00021462 [Ensete ventricosum]|nr:hypothetical protein BHE74_00021462 [Ensete ventricosum]